MVRAKVRRMEESSQKRQPEMADTQVVVMADVQDVEMAWECDPLAMFGYYVLAWVTSGIPVLCPWWAMLLTLVWPQCSVMWVLTCSPRMGA